MADYSVDYLRRLDGAVADFQAAFDTWMATQVEGDLLGSRGLFPTAWPKEGADPETVTARELEVARTAGIAARAVVVTGAYTRVAGVGTLDPISNWSLMSMPRATFTPRDVRTCAATVRGRLEALVADAEAGASSDLPTFSPANFHPLVWAAASAHWTAHQYRVAVREGAEALAIEWKTRLGATGVTNDNTFWQDTLSGGDPAPGKPKLVWPGDPTTATARNMRGGLAPMAKSLHDLAKGLNLTVRNVTTHTRDELTEQEAMERLAAYSYLARLLDNCEISHADEQTGG